MWGVTLTLDTSFTHFLTDEIQMQMLPNDTNLIVFLRYLIMAKLYDTILSIPYDESNPRMHFYKLSERLIHIFVTWMCLASGVILFQLFYLYKYQLDIANWYNFIIIIIKTLVCSANAFTVFCTLLFLYSG